MYVFILNATTDSANSYLECNISNAVFLTNCEKSDNHFLLTVYPAELKSYSHGTNVASYLLCNAFMVM